LLERRVNTSAVVVVEQKMDRVKLLVLLADDRYVRVEKGEGRGEALGDETKLGKVGVDGGER